MSAEQQDKQPCSQAEEMDTLSIQLQYSLGDSHQIVTVQVPHTATVETIFEWFAEDRGIQPNNDVFVFQNVKLVPFGISLQTLNVNTEATFHIITRAPGQHHEPFPTNQTEMYVRAMHQQQRALQGTKDTFVREMDRVVTMSNVTAFITSNDCESQIRQSTRNALAYTQIVREMKVQQQKRGVSLHRNYARVNVHNNLYPGTAIYVVST